MTGSIKQAVLDLAGYISPPQQNYRAKLNQNESPFDLPDELKRKLLESAGQIAWNRYPAYGSPRLREKLAARHSVTADHILLGNGSNQLLSTLITATLNPGDGVLFCPPTFSLFDLYARVAGATQISVARAPGEPFPVRECHHAIERTHPKLILLCSPNNPTGAEIALQDLAGICDRASGLVLLDEAYGEFTDRSALELLERFPNLIVSRTCSKAFGLAGLRLGYLVAAPRVIAELVKINLPYNINHFTEHVVLGILAEPGQISERVRYLVEQRERMAEALASMMPGRVYPSAANFLLVRSYPGRDLVTELRDRGVLVRDVSEAPQLRDHFRVTVGMARENDIFLDTLEQLLDEGPEEK